MNESIDRDDKKERTAPARMGRRTTFRPNTNAAFPPTRWSLVTMAGDASEDNRRDALRQLCEHYHEAIYGFVRRSLRQEPVEALDLTNGFIAALLEVAPRISFVPQTGRSGKPVKFRSYVCSCVKYYLIGQRRKMGPAQIPETEEEFEQHCRLCLTEEGAPDPVFDQSWAESMMRKVLCKLESRLGAQEPELFARWVKHGREKLPDGELDTVAHQTGKTPGALRTHYSRLKERWAAAAVQELFTLVGETLPLATPITLMEEVNAIRQILLRSGAAGAAGWWAVDAT